MKNGQSHRTNGQDQPETNRTDGKHIAIAAMQARIESPEIWRLRTSKSTNYTTYRHRPP